jgi:hypothetical protein
VVDPSRRLELIHRATLNIMLGRLQAFLTRDKVGIRKAVTRACLFLTMGRRYDTTARKWEDFLNLDATDNKTQDLPSEWLFHFVQNITIWDPRLLFAGTYRSYKTQTEAYDLLKVWPNIHGSDDIAIPDIIDRYTIDVEGYPPLTDPTSGKPAVDGICAAVYDAFAKHLKAQQNLDTLLQSFVELRDVTLDPKPEGNPFRGAYRAAPADDYYSAPQPLKPPATTAGGNEFPLARNITGDAARAPAKHDPAKITLMRVGKDNPTEWDKCKNKCTWNWNLKRAQLFAMLDASGLLWNAREFFNPADANRPKHTPEGNQDDMHYWCRTYVESFLAARERYKARRPNNLWEADVKLAPAEAFPPTLIGAMADDTWRKLFPLLPMHDELRDTLRRIRALDVLWGELPSYSCGDGIAKRGAWMPLSQASRVQLLDTVGLYDRKYHVPTNPWPVHEGKGIGRVYSQSYHSVYYTSSYRDGHFREWLKHACRYQPPRSATGDCFYPFSQYGGTPTEGDFLPHRVEAPHESIDARRHAQLVYNRFGFTKPLRVGQQFHDTGLLQDLFQFEYRPYADLSHEQRQMPKADAVYPSNFMAYARTHAIIALASCNHGTDEGSIPRIVRNLYRLFVDTYECMGARPDDDGVPVVLGFLPQKVVRKEDRPVTLFAGSLNCLNAKLERFCTSGANKGERVCQNYKQVYLNDATMLFTRLLRAQRRKELHDANFRKARFRRGASYTRERFDADLIDLQDAYIDFLQQTVLGMLLESGANLNNVPLHLLEPRELEVSMYEEDDNVVGNDFLTPRTREVVKDMDFGGDTLSKTQMAILSLIPPHNRILGTLRFDQKTQVVDLEHVRKMIQQQTLRNNEKVWDKYIDKMLDASLAVRFLETDGSKIDYGFDISAIKDPLKEAAGLPRQISTAPRNHTSSSLSQQVRGEALRRETGKDSVLGMNSNELQQALQLVRNRVEQDFAIHGGRVPRIKCLAQLKRVPDHLKRMLRPEYE